MEWEALSKGNVVDIDHKWDPHGPGIHTITIDESKSVIGAFLTTPVRSLATRLRSVIISRHLPRV